jgi:DNA invertase Pin-like site-specific DNA recombinase
MAHTPERGNHPELDTGLLYLDPTSGAKSSRPAWDALSKAPRAGDVLVATRLDRVGSLVTLLDQLAGRGVAFRFLEQGIDTTTSEGRADVSDAGRHRRVPAGLDHRQHPGRPPRAPEAAKAGASPNSPDTRCS